MSFVKSQLAVTLSLGLFSDVMVPEDVGTIYLRKTKEVKFAGDLNSWSCCGKSFITAIDFGPVLPTVKR